MSNTEREGFMERLQNIAETESWLEKEKEALVEEVYKEMNTNNIQLKDVKEQMCREKEWIQETVSLVFIWY